MFLKTLTLKGFKSFAEPTTLELQPGLTVVVGPNGSGKSNVVDAVAWVLGAQGPRTLRSSRMEDVIFAGAANRPPLGRAEVSVTIDNSARLLPVDLAEVTVTRTLFRSDESEYAINGAPCRLLDVQELLSDAGVGRQQHVIVSQGHLDAVLDSRPEGRRALIEEAAGVHKYRRRRDKAQRRLDATEEDLVRLQDLLREVRRQLRALERQAQAARRQQTLQEERRAVRLHLAGVELDRFRTDLEAAARARADLGAVESSLEEEEARLATLVAEAESHTFGDHDDDDDLVRFERLRGRARGLAALLAERRRAARRRLGDDLDERLSSLEAERTGLEAELHAVEADAAALGPRADEVAAAEAAVAAERSAFEGQREEPSAAGRRVAEVRGELAALGAALVRSRSELDAAHERRRAVDDREAELEAEAARLGADQADAERRLRRVTAERDACEARRQGAVASEAEADAEADRARHGHQLWEARAEALASVLHHGGADAARLAAMSGALGTLLDLVEVDEGWEAAFEAAVGGAGSAVVLEGVAVARRALHEARDQRLGGTLIALEPGQPPASGTVPAPTGTADHDGLRGHVRSTAPGVDALLDTLLSGVVSVEDWEDGVELVLARPGLVAVTLEGDRFSAREWRVGPSAVPTRAALQESRSRAAEAADALAAAEERLMTARSALAELAAAQVEAAGHRDAAEAQLRELADAVRVVEDQRRAAAAESQSVRAHVGRQAQRVGAEESRIAQLEVELPRLEAEDAAAADRRRAVEAERARLADRLAAVSTLRTDLEVRAAALEERRALLSRRLGEVGERLQALEERRASAARQRAQLERAAAATTRLEALVADRLSTVESRLEALHERRHRRQDAARAAAERLDRLRRERTAAVRGLEDARERRREVELEEAALRLRAEATVQALRRELGCGPEAAAGAPCPDLPPELPPDTGPSERLQQLDDELRAVGPVNALALEDQQALGERHAFVEGQLEDVRSARRELGKVVRAIDDEITEVFAAAFADVSENFAKLFASLFPGGTAHLRLTHPDDLLGTGIEVEARPSGKRVGKLSLLSGGERSLTALAFLFAVFRSRPSPFYLLDEVEAALDDVNLNRFLELVNEFRDEAQLVVVSHQKRTMEAADCLYGVTMQPGGSSMVVSERVREEAATGAGVSPR